MMIMMQILGPCQRTEKTVEYEGQSDTNCSWFTWNCPQETGGIGNQWED